MVGKSRVDMPRMMIVIYTVEASDGLLQCLFVGMQRRQQYCWQICQQQHYCIKYFTFCHRYKKKQLSFVIPDYLCVALRIEQSYLYGVGLARTLVLHIDFVAGTVTPHFLHQLGVCVYFDVVEF